MATIVKAPSGKWKAILRKNNKVLKTKSFRLKEHAKKWARRMEADQGTMDALGTEGASIRFNALADEYWTHWSKDHNTHGIKGRMKVWRNAFGDMLILDITASMIRKELHRYEKKHSPASTNRLKACLSSIFKYAISEQGYLTVNPARLVAARTEPDGVARYLSDDEREALLDACRASEWDKLYLLAIMGIGTGARLGELQRLRWNDIDFAERTAILYTTKNGSPRLLSLPAPVVVELMKFREIGSALIFRSISSPDKPFAFRKHWNKARADSGIESFRFHDLRHTCASYLAMNGATLSEIADVLGHKTLAVTQRYTHLSINHKQKLTDRVLGDVLGK